MRWTRLLERLNRFDLAPSPVSTDLWEVAAAACSLVDGRVYHYWFEVTNANPKLPSAARILCTDPTAATVDWTEVTELVDASFRMVAAKKLVKQLDER